MYYDHYKIRFSIMIFQELSKIFNGYNPKLIFFENIFMR